MKNAVGASLPKQVGKVADATPALLRIVGLLTEAQHAEQLARKVSLLARCEDRAEEFKRLFRSDLEWEMRSMETLDTQQERRLGGAIGELGL